MSVIGSGDTLKSAIDNAYYNAANPVAEENLIARLTANTYTLGFITTGEQYFWIKAYDSFL